MKRFLKLTIIIVALVCIYLPARTYASESITGTYISQVDGTKYIFKSDGSLLCDDEAGAYYISDDVITMIINGYVEKHTFEILDELLILYDSSAKGVSYTEAQEDVASEVESEQETQITNAEDSHARIDFEELARSVLLLYCYNEESDLIATGSGFMAFDDKTIITNYHVIEGITKVVAVNEYGFEIEITNVSHFDINRDIAILNANEETGLTPLTIGDSSFTKKGDEVYTIGSPQGLINTVSSGLLSGEITIGDQIYLQLSAPTSAGSSGGVLLNDQGQVIGVTTSTLTDGQNLNFAIPINDVVELFNRKSNKMSLSECIEIITPIKNGKKIIEPTVKTYAPIRVYTTAASKGFYYYFYLDSKKYTGEQADVGFIIQGGATGYEQIPAGNYDIYYCAGTTWYGREKKFGEEGHYYKLTDRYDFSEKTGISITLLNVFECQVASKEISYEEFPY